MHVGLGVASLVARMAADSDSIDDMPVLRHGGMVGCSHTAYSPSKLGSSLLGLMRPTP